MDVAVLVEGAALVQTGQDGITAYECIYDTYPSVTSWVDHNDQLDVMAIGTGGGSPDTLYHNVEYGASPDAT
jgi:hypothetical protein